MGCNEIKDPTPSLRHRTPLPTLLLPRACITLPIHLCCVPSFVGSYRYNPPPPLRICHKGEIVLTYLPARLQKVKGTSDLPRLMLCAILLLVAAIDTKAGSTHSSATLHIQITVAPALQASVNLPQNTAQPEPGTVTYDLKSQNQPALTQKTTIGPLIRSHQDGGIPAGSSSAAQPAVLETLTIVPR